ncbi:hypothetical protein SUGI_0612940 [Cryptomeria japonica]|nr:hypothetical protein SUGI_0612940 [Cryptomeria japonica]
MKRRGPEDTVNIFKQLVSLGCQPGQATYASIIIVSAQLGMYQTAEALVGEMTIKGFIRCVVEYANAIAMYASLGMRMLHFGYFISRGQGAPQMRSTILL